MPWMNGDRSRSGSSVAVDVGHLVEELLEKRR